MLGCSPISDLATKDIIKQVIKLKQTALAFCKNILIW